MNIRFSEKLSNTDDIASNEQEVRDVLIVELREYADEVSTDCLGSIISKRGNRGPKITLCTCIDEVGFIMCSISDMGQVMLMSVGDTKPLVQFIQEVRITAEDGKKIRGIIQATYENNVTTKVYVDLEAQTTQEVYDLGIQVGDMMTYATEFEHPVLVDVVAGKAFDDRLGYFVMGEALKRLQGIDYPDTVYTVGISSREVEIRGAKTAVYKASPDVVFPIDVACSSSEPIRNHTNRRQTGKEVILANFDHTLAPSRTLVRRIKDTANALYKPPQLDIFNEGGTDGGEAYKNRDGKPTAVSCLPVRYGHCVYSVAHLQGIVGAIGIFTELITNFDEVVYCASTDFLKGV